jgi:hypothetical protein
MAPWEDEITCWHKEDWGEEGWLIHVQNTKEMETPMPNNFELCEGIGHSLCINNQT